MKITCQACSRNLSGQHTGEETTDAKCPDCGEILKRSIVVELSGFAMGISSATANLYHRTYPEALLDEVTDLINRRKFTLAIVVAQMSCEISMERALSRAFDKLHLDQRLVDAIRDLLPKGNPLTNVKVLNLYNVLAPMEKGTDHAKGSFGMQSELEQLARWRNGAIHRGLTWGESEAQTALTTATELVQRLKL